MEPDKHICDEARHYFDSRLAEDGLNSQLSPEQRHQLDDHLRTCQPCLSWQKEVTDITVAAANMPEYSVPEALTQSILTAVQKEPLPVRAQALNAVLVSVSAFVALLAFLLIESIESFNGALSWLVCFAIMIAVGQFIQERPARLEMK